ncbi:biliverdin-producing heme oxygenase [Caulobacter segnis]|uniref:biliverdin-producing heme oxygenase n=1 Tax=Caulobacter segnis TaxID=88688 RepID=UPI001CBFB3E6|nr:biliverdin-producing heme oxygenase [Caulobacter segnis]UAL10521.1 biliverdin-producing heme oxygenase [Caulobacter segnis]
MSDISLRDRLRAATTESHAALDATVAGWRIETPLGYGAFLSASAAALAPLELALERAGVAEWLPDWAHRARRAGLARDLAALGLEAPPFASATVPDRDFAAGLLYVLEGSRLGARFLARQVRGADAGLPLAYLTHGEGQELWRSFVAWLEAIPKVGFRTDAAEAGARYGFRCFSDAFERLAPSPGSLNVRTGAHVRV